MSTAILPSLSRQAADGDQKALLGTMGYGLRLILFITVPAMVGLLVLARPLVVLLFMRGEFTLAMAGETAGAVMGLAAGLWAIAGVRAVVQSFYALKDIKTPVLVAALCLVIKLGFSLALMGPLQANRPGPGHLGLGGGQPAAALLWLLRKRVGLLGGRRLLHLRPGHLRGGRRSWALLVALVAYGPDWGDRPSGGMWRWARPGAALLAGAGSYFAGRQAYAPGKELGELWQVFRSRRA